MQLFKGSTIALTVCAMCGCGPELPATSEGPYVDRGGGESQWSITDAVATPDSDVSVGEVAEAGAHDTRVAQGTFLSACTTNLECDSGYCVETRAGKKCTKTCVNNCPSGMKCTPNQSPGDVNYICTDPWVPLCQPCISNVECLGGEPHTCAMFVGGDTNGKFCLPSCTEGKDCPENFSCVAVTGNSGPVCVPKVGECTCTPRAIALKATTTCKSGEFSCPGTRSCTPQGLTTCAPLIKPETCNLKDDDCNGKTDDGLCEDGNSCTADACNPDGSCKHEILNGLLCNDGNDCTQVDGCVDGKCAGGKPVPCDDSNVCTNDSCKPITGCVYENNGKPCDDSNVCTDNDTCGAGSCSVTKPHPCGDNNPCTSDSCKPGKGCVFAPLTDPKAGIGACPSDGNNCTEDKCSGGGCKHVPIPGCSG